jgi:hypothetical protein
VEALTSELKDGKNPQPAFIERAFKSGKPREINVIWDKWVGVPEEERSDVIRKAYERFDKSIAENIEFALGYTSADAISAGLLPFVVYCFSRAGHSLLERELVIDAEQVHTIQGNRSRELRYPTQEEAIEAIKRLEGTLSGSEWRIKEEVEY